MGIIVKSEQFIAVVSLGLSKVTAGVTTLAAKDGYLQLTFSNAAVRYQKRIACGEGKIAEVAFDAVMLKKLFTDTSGDAEISVNGPELIVKRGRSNCKVQCIAASTMSEFAESENDDTAADAEGVDPNIFQGWLKKHPLSHLVAYKKNLTAIRDNLTKEELVVEAEWGEDVNLILKIADQFHGIIVYVTLPEIPAKKRVRIRLPLNSFLLLLDITGKLYVDAKKAMITDDTQTLSCKFIVGSSFGSIDEMAGLINKFDPKVEAEAKDFLSICKRVTAICEDDDTVTLHTKNKHLIVAASTEKAAVREALMATGSIDKMTLSPKNLFDLANVMAGTVKFDATETALLMRCKRGDAVVYGAMVKYGI